MPVSVVIPVRVRVDARALSERFEEIEDALAGAASRALVRSREEVLEPRGGYVAPQWGAPTFLWHGDGLSALTSQQRADCEERLGALLAAMASRLLVVPAAPGATVPATPLSVPPAEPFDAARAYLPAAGEDAPPEADGAYLFPSYQGGTVTAPVTRAGKEAAQEPWTLLLNTDFIAQVSDYLDWMRQLDPAAAVQRDRFADILADLRRVQALVARANRHVFIKKELLPRLRRLAEEARRPDAESMLLVGWTTVQGDAHRLKDVDVFGTLAGNLDRLTPLNLKAGRMGRGREETLLPGGWLLFTAMVVPLVTFERYIDEPARGNVGTYFVEKSQMGDLGFLIDPKRFERRFEVSWESFLEEYRTLPVAVTGLCFVAKRRAHARTLRYLLRERARARQDVPGGSERATVFDLPVLLNGAGLAQLPQALRALAEPYTDPVTRGAAAAPGLETTWEAGWSGCYFVAVLDPTPEQIDAARFRPEARRVADQIATFLKRDPRERVTNLAGNVPWRYTLETLLTDTYRRARHPGGFTYLLEELEKRQLFDTFFDKVGETRYYTLIALVAELALKTRFSEYASVKRLLALLNGMRRAGSKYAYHTDPQEVLLDKDDDLRIGVGTVAFDVYSWCGVKQPTTRVKPDRMPALMAAIQEASNEVMGRLARGEETAELDEAAFLEKVAQEGARRAGLTEDDLENVVLTRSVKVLGVERREEDGVEKFYVRCVLVQRVTIEDSGETGAWTDIEGTEKTLLDSKFEEMMEAWRQQNLGRVVTILGVVLVVTSVVVVGLAAFPAAGAAVVAAGGGGLTITVSIALSVAFYLYQTHYVSAEGILMSALEGYLGAVFFKVGGGLGLGAARQVSTRFVTSQTTTWFVHKMVTGLVGGTATGATQAFAEHVVRTALGQQKTPALKDYISKMTIGALCGVAFEIGVTALKPLVKLAGGATLRSVREVLSRLKAEGFTVETWAGIHRDAVRAIREGVGRGIDPAKQKPLFDALLEAVEARFMQVTRAYAREIRGEIALTTLKAGGVRMTQAAKVGLDRLLGATASDLKDDAARALLTELARGGGNTTRLLSVLNDMEEDALRRLIATGRVDILLKTPSAITLLERRGAGAVDDLAQILARPDAETAATATLQGVPLRPLNREAFVEAVLGQARAAERDAVLADLDRLNRSAAETLRTEFPVDTGKAALALLIERRAQMAGARWSLEAVRGLAEMLRLERGHSAATVRRLLTDLPAAEAGTLFERYGAIVGSQKVGGVAPLLVGPNLGASVTQHRVALVRRIMAEGIELPAGMDDGALRGLEKMAADRPATWLQDLKAIALDRRLRRLKQMDPAATPSGTAAAPPGPVGRLEQVLREQRADLRPGLNPLSKTPEEVVKAFEARIPQGSGGGFSEPRVRDEAVRLVERYQRLVRQLQAGENVERNVVGAREELEAVLKALEQGADVFQIGNVVTLRINPGMYPLPGGGRLVNGPEDIAVQMDVAGKTVKGDLFGMEATTGKLSLPEFLKGLDPQTPGGGGDIDFRAFDLNNASHRKWLQVIKLHNVSRFCGDLAKSFGGTAKPPQMIYSGEVTASARRVLEAFGFTVQ